MILDVIGTGSSGNCYVLRGEQGGLLLDAGLPMREIVRFFADNGGSMPRECLVTHEHGDHAKAIKDLIKRGINVYMSGGTIEATGAKGAKCVETGKVYEMGAFSVIPFKTEHDAAEPVGFLIRERSTGETAVYATDTYYLTCTFPGVNYWVIECNYTDDLIPDDLAESFRRRLLTSHMSLKRLKTTLQANDLSKTRKIVLVHLSDGRSDEKKMILNIEGLTGIETVAAHNGERIYLGDYGGF